MKRFGIIWVCVCLSAMFAGGCSENQRATADRFAPTAETVGQGVADFAAGPTGSILPPDVRLYASLGGLILAAAAAAWQKVRKDQAVETLGAVAKAVDKAGPGHKDAVKGMVTVDATGAALIEKAKRA